MFERNRVDNANASAHQVAVTAEITLDDGCVQIGHLIINAARAIADVLNSETLFVEFEPLGEARRYLAKSAIRAIKLTPVATANALDARRPIQGEFDPYAALGVTPDTDWDDVRTAYLKLAKAYHADRYASIDLPYEVRTYFQQMSRRVNAAYTLLEAPRLVVKKADLRAAAVYISQPR